MPNTTAATLLVLLTLVFVHGAHAENWPNWRGPSSNGVASGTGYPTSWGEEDNIAWKIKVPGWGTSTPAIWGDQIYVSCDDGGKNALVSVDRSGKQLWKTTFGPAASNKNRKASAANPSPVTDGSHVWVYYKSGELACVSADGKTV